MSKTMIPPEVVQQPRVQQLLARSALYEALALMLSYPSDESLERASTLLEDVADHELAAAWGLEEQLERLRAAREQVDADRLAPAHFVLFEGSVLCSPHETEYIRDPFAKGAQLADIAGFYAAFGVKTSRLHPTTPDEIATELEFMSLITRKEAYALVRGWEEHATTARDAGRRFLETHLGRWTGAFTADLCARSDEAAASRNDPPAGAWFHALGDLLRAVVADDCAVQGAYPSLLSTRYADPDADAMVCPMAAGVTQFIRDDEIALEDAIRATGPAESSGPEPPSE